MHILNRMMVNKLTDASEMSSQIQIKTKFLNSLFFI